MITQSDVTMRTRMEMAMAQLTESQLGMLSQVRQGAIGLGLLGLLGLHFPRMDGGNDLLIT